MIKSRFFTAIILLSGNFCFGQELNFEISTGPHIDGKVNILKSLKFEPIGYFNEKYYYWSYTEIGQSQIVCCNKDLTPNKIIQVTTPANLSHAHLESLQSFTSDHYILHFGRTADMGKNAFAIYSQKITFDPFYLEEPIKAAEFQGNIGDVESIVTHISENKEYLGIGIEMKGNGKNCIYHYTILDREMKNLGTGTNQTKEFKQKHILGSVFMSNQGDLFLSFDNRDSRATGFQEPINFGSILKFTGDKKTGEYNYEFENKLILNYELNEDAEGYITLETIWCSKAKSSQTGMLSYAFENNTINYSIPFDPKFNRPFRRIKSTTMVDSEKDKGLSVHFSLQKRLETTYTNYKLLVFEKVARSQSDEETTSVYYGSFLIYLIDDNNTIQKQIEVKKLTETTGQTTYKKSNVIFQKDDNLYFIYKKTTPSPGKEDKSIIYPNRNFENGVSYFMTRVNLITSEKTTIDFITHKQKAFILNDILLLNSYFQDTDNSFVIAANSVGKIYLVRFTLDN